MTHFELHPQLQTRDLIIDMSLCRVLLEDNRYYPWLLLIPRRPRLLRFMDISLLDQMQLMKELQIAQEILWEEFNPTQLNVAAIGNRIPQLHIHVIARFNHDPAWPGTVWDHSIREKYEIETKEHILHKLKTRFELIFNK